MLQHCNIYQTKKSIIQTSGLIFCGVWNNPSKAFCKRAKKSSKERAQQSEAFFGSFFMVTRSLRQGPSKYYYLKLSDGCIRSFLYWYILRKVYTTHMRVHAILKVGLGITKYHKAPSFLASVVHWAFPLEAHNHGSPEQLASETSGNNSFSIWSKPRCVSE